MRILVVDDERAIADYLAEMLHQNGYRALPLYSAADALEHLQVFRFHLALLGIIMPGMTGIELGERMRKVLPSCKIILIDPKDTVDAVKAARNEFEYLATPFAAEELLSKVQGVALKDMRQ